jgi:hypothetical protein
MPTGDTDTGSIFGYGNSLSLSSSYDSTLSLAESRLAECIEKHPACTREEVFDQPMRVLDLGCSPLNSDNRLVSFLDTQFN